MKQSVRLAFRSFTGDLEGADVPFMYCDILGLVTTGNGNLVDPVSACVGLPWRWKATDTLATRDEIASAWHDTKSRQDLKMHGGMAYEAVTGLYLDKQALDDLFWSRLGQNETILRNRFPSYDGWPADAQMALHSMAWAMGPWFRFHNFEHHALLEEFDGCAAECRIVNGATKRNKANQLMFENAYHAELAGDDGSVLHWPGEVSGSITIPAPAPAFDETPTSPDCPDARLAAAFYDSTRPTRG